MACATSPTKAAFVASRYGPRPGRRTGAIRFHAGLDFRAPYGTAVLAPSEGIVESMVSDDGELATTVPRGVSARPFNGYGNVLVLRLPGPVWMSFNHLSAFAPGLRPGMIVPKGALLGLVGNTSNGKFRGMGAHLHIETRHAPGDGRLTPFPGPYGRDNFDPIEWFERNGLELDGRRLMKTSMCVPPTTTGRSKALSGLGQIEWKRIADQGTKAPPGTEYEPPRKMAPSLGMVALSIGAGLGMLGLARAVWAGHLRIPFADRIPVPFGHVPEHLFDEIRSESTKARGLKINPNTGLGVDCDESYNRLANGYRLLLKASVLSASKKEDARIDRLAASYDKAADFLDGRCD